MRISDWSSDVCSSDLAHPCRCPSGAPAVLRRRGVGAVRFAITALGSTGGRTVGQVVNAIVRYLEPRTPTTPSMDRSAPRVPSGEGPASYYSDRGTEPGRWLGVTARETGLIGPVDPHDFARVLAGRDPRTGGRLVSASGSAGRRPTLGVGQHTATSPSGEAIYRETDAGAALGLEPREIGRASCRERVCQYV